MLVAEVLNDKKQSVSNAINFWQSADIYFKEKSYTLQNFDYPFWNDVSKQSDISIYRGVVSLIEKDKITVELDNAEENQLECYSFPRNFFDFRVEQDEIIELVVEKKYGECSIKPKKYEKPYYYINKENQIINKIVNLMDEDDDF